jgi:hypothetical protein
MTVRVNPETRRIIERDARRNRQSLSDEAERIFNDAARSRGDEKMRALTFLISQLCEILPIRGLRNMRMVFDWLHNRSDFEALRSAVMGLVDRLAPQGEIDPGRYAPSQEVLTAWPPTAGNTLQCRRINLGRAPPKHCSQRSH